METDECSSLGLMEAFGCWSRREGDACGALDDALISCEAAARGGAERREGRRGGGSGMRGTWGGVRD